VIVVRWIQQRSLNEFLGQVLAVTPRLASLARART